MRRPLSNTILENILPARRACNLRCFCYSNMDYINLYRISCMTYLVVFAHQDNFEHGTSESPEATLIRIDADSVREIRATTSREHYEHQEANSVVSVLI